MGFIFCLLIFCHTTRHVRSKFPNQGLNPHFLPWKHWKRGVLTTRLPGNPLSLIFFTLNILLFDPSFWEILKAGGERNARGWDGWMASLTWWTWVWASSGSWCWTRKPGVLQSMGSQRVGYDWATELNLWLTIKDAQRNLLCTIDKIPWVCLLGVAGHAQREIKKFRKSYLKAIVCLAKLLFCFATLTLTTIST